MSVLSPNVDAYGHVSLPRFISVEDYLRAMDSSGIDKAILTTAETCPDIPEVSRAIVHHADRLRAVGVPLGRSYAEICESIEHQVDCGFIGFRVQAKMIVQYPEVMQVFGKHHIVPFVVGDVVTAIDHLLHYLEADSRRLVVAPHFCGMTGPLLLNTPGPVLRLFQHPRFLVIFSRQGAFDSKAIRQWAAQIIRAFGWQKALYGSEFPVCLWRNESYLDTFNWIQSLDLHPTDAELAAFYGETALRLFWHRQPAATHLADEKWTAKNWTAPGSVSLLPNHTLDISEETHHRLLAIYLKNDGQTKFYDYREYLTWVFNTGCEKLFQEDNPLA